MNGTAATRTDRHGLTARRAVPALVAAMALVGSACADGGNGSAPRRLAVSAAIDVGEGSSAVAVGEEAVWVADGRSTVVRLDPNTNTVAARVSVPSGAMNVAVGEGAVWATGPTALARIDPSRNRVTATAELGAPQGVAAGRGAVWVANRAGDGTLSRVDPKTMQVVAAAKVPPLPGDQLGLPQEPAQVAVGEGGVWVTDARVGTVSRLDTKSNRFTLTLSRIGPASRGLATGAGSVWVVGDLQVSRADPSRRFPDTLEISDNPSPTGVAVGLGAAWITDLADDALIRVDPVTGRRTGAVELQDGPLALAIGFGSVWVAGRDGLVTRVDQR